MVWRKWGRERTKSWGSVLRLILGPGSLVRRYPVALYLSKYIICINKYILTSKFHLFFYFVFILFFKLLYTFLYYSLFIVLLFSLFYFIYLSIYLYLFHCFFLFRFLIFFNLKLEIEKILLFPSLKCKNEKKILNNIFNF